MKIKTGKTLFNKTVYSLKWSYTFTAFTILAQIASTALLARILNPKDYGLVTTANVILRFGSFFAQMGIGSAIIQKQITNKKEIITAFAISTIISVLLYVIFFILAPFSFLFLTDKDLTLIIRLLGINFVFTSIASVSISILRLKYKFFLLGLIDFIAFLIGNVAFSIILAYQNFGVWSLVYSAILQNVILFAFLLYNTKEYLGFSSINYTSAKSILNYGSKYTLSSFADVLIYSVDSVIISKYFESKILGIYNRASLLVQLPSQYISTNFIKVFFPVFSEIKQDKKKFSKHFQSVSLLLGLVLFAACIFIAIAAKEIVLILLGPKWIETVNILRICALAVPFNLLINYHALVYDIYGFLKIKLAIKLAHLVVMISLLYAGIKLNGFYGLAMGFALTEVLFYFVYLIVGVICLKEKLLIILYKQLNYLYIIAVIGSSTFVIHYLCNKTSLSIFVGLLAEIILVPVLFLSIVFVYIPNDIKNLLKDFFVVGKIDLLANSKDNLAIRAAKQFLRSVLKTKPPIIINIK